MKSTSFKFDEKTTQLLDELKEGSHAASRTEVIRKALYLLKVATEAQQNNSKIIIKKEGGPDREIVMY